MKRVPLTRGLFALVDDSDYAWVSRYRWHAMNCRDRRYAARNIRRKDGRITKIMMHREITAAKDGQVTDHKNSDPLDNRRCNLRVCTDTQNKWNCGPQKNNRSGYRGVFIDKNIPGKYRASINTNGARVYLGYFTTPEAAARAYDAAARKYHGEYAYLNFRHTSQHKTTPARGQGAFV